MSILEPNRCHSAVPGAPSLGEARIHGVAVPAHRSSVDQRVHLAHEAGGVRHQLLDCAWLEFAERQVVGPLPALEEAIECSPTFGLDMA
jgi:hypothetical protein